MGIPPEGWVGEQGVGQYPMTQTQYNALRKCQMTEDQIKYMVNRFLSWKLPADFNPDGGITFKRMYNEHTTWPMKHEPSGTNLLDATQADAMVRHMLEGLPHGSRN
jgi:hypothetical protein